MKKMTIPSLVALALGLGVSGSALAEYVDFTSASSVVVRDVAAAQSFETTLYLTPTVTDKLAFTFSGLASQFSKLSYTFLPLGSETTGGLIGGNRIAIFNDFKNTTNTPLVAGTTYLLKIAGTANTTLPGVYGSATFSAVNGTVSAVPEPESFAMLLAGLGLMGAVARRRASRQA